LRKSLQAWKKGESKVGRKRKGHTDEAFGMNLHPVRKKFRKKKGGENMIPPGGGKGFLSKNHQKSQFRTKASASVEKKGPGKEGF